LESFNGGQYVYKQVFEYEKPKLRIEWNIIAKDMHAQMITDLIVGGAKPIESNNFDTRLVELEADNKILQASNRELQEKLNKLINIFKQVKEL
jgi:hypothetical protein